MHGRLEEVDGRYRLVFTRTLKHPPEKVWKALTEPEHLAAWFPTRIDGEPRAGAPLTFVFTGGEGPPFHGEMLVFDPPTRLSLRWGDDILDITLRPDGDGTLLTLVDQLDELGKAARDAAGWHDRLDHLEHHLDGRPAPGDVWVQVHPWYVEQLGPEASSIGPPNAAG